MAQFECIDILIRNTRLYLCHLCVSTVICLKVSSGGRRGLTGALAHRPVGPGRNPAPGPARTRRRPS